MSLKDDIPVLVGHAKELDPVLRHNRILFDIFEGDLLRYVLEDARRQLSPQSFAQFQFRVSPINILKRFVDKLSKIYQQNPTRRPVDGRENDFELLNWYEESFRIDKNLNISNEFYNLFKNNLFQVFLNKGVPSLRAIPSDRFLVFSDDIVDPTNPTHVMLMFEVKDEKGENAIIFHVYTDEEFIIVDSEGKIMAQEMEMMGNEGVNPIGKLPFVYTNQSTNLLIPKPDSDTLTMTKLIPLLLSDLNFGQMFATNGIIYGINVTEEKLEKSPNSFWRLKSDNPDEKPEIGTIKPEMDILGALQLVQSELAFWLQSKGIRPGAVGSITTENFASGISKMVDEMDTAESRMKQVDVYKEAEQDLWDLVINHAHPYWLDTGEIDQSLSWTPGVTIQTNFAEQIPMIRRGEVIEDLAKEMENGFISRQRAIKKLNPQMSDEEIDELLEEIQGEKALSISLQQIEDGEAEATEDDEQVNE